MIVAEEMQHAMHEKMAHMGGHRFALRRGFAAHRRPGEDHIAQLQRRRALVILLLLLILGRVVLILLVLLEIVGIAAGKGEDVGRLVLAAPFAVERLHALVGGEHDRDLAQLEARRGRDQRRSRGALHQSFETHARRRGLLPAALLDR
jgi:hypothetical protein